jgi:phosphatidylglycerophosphate synthase
VTGSCAGPTLWIASTPAPPSGAAAPLLGLPIARRAILAGQRAGFQRILVEAFEGVGAIVADTPAALLRRDAPPAPSGRLVVLSPGTLPQISWLRSMASVGIEAGTVLCDGTAAAAFDLVESDAMPAALLSRPADAGAVQVLAALRPASAATLPSRAGRFEVRSPSDVPAAENWLLSSLVKETEGFMSRHVERRVSLAISRRLASTAVTPNAMTLVSVAVGLAGAAFFLSTRRTMEFAGALLFLLHSILDGCDGELARLKFSESRAGGVLDFWGDNVVHSAVFAAIAIAWRQATGETWPVAAGFAAVAGTLAAAAFVYWTAMSHTGRDGPAFVHATVGPPTAVSRVADALARRDFIYLVVLLSAFGKAHWFLAAAAVGAPLYLAVLVAIASRRLGRSFS